MDKLKVTLASTDLSISRRRRRSGGGFFLSWTYCQLLLTFILHIQRIYIEVPDVLGDLLVDDQVALFITIQRSVTARDPRSLKSRRSGPFLVPANTHGVRAPRRHPEVDDYRRAVAVANEDVVRLDIGANYSTGFDLLLLLLPGSWTIGVAELFSLEFSHGVYPSRGT